MRRMDRWDVLYGAAMMVLLLLTVSIFVIILLNAVA